MLVTLLVAPSDVPCIPGLDQEKVIDASNHWGPNLDTPFTAALLERGIDRRRRHWRIDLSPRGQVGISLTVIPLSLRLYKICYRLEYTTTLRGFEGAKSMQAAVAILGSNNCRLRLCGSLNPLGLVTCARLRGGGEREVWSGLPARP